MQHYLDRNGTLRASREVDTTDIDFSNIETGSATKPGLPSTDLNGTTDTAAATMFNIGTVLPFVISTLIGIFILFAARDFVEYLMFSKEK